MTDAIISVVVEQLFSFVEQEVKLVVSVRKDVKALTSTLKMVQAVLRDAETRQIKEEAVKLWLEELKAIVYDAKDVLDEWNTRNHCSLLKGVEDGRVRIHNKVLSYLLPLCFSTRSVVVRYDIGSRIKEIRKSLDVVNHDKEQLGLNISCPSHEVSRDRLTSSIIDVANIYGRDHDKNILVSLLLGESSAHVMNTDVISIVGTGGFGKTTLANLVLEEGDVKNAFEKRIFVCVSDPFDLLKVARSIMEQVTGNSPTVKERESLLKCLCETLKGKRFLIVLDDFWTENSNDWTPLKVAFDGGAQGSWVIVTTRSKKVAELMHSKHTHNLARLSDPDSWLLFEHIAFARRSEEFLLKFEKIGKKIVAKCKGVPLAIKTVGSLMRSMKTKNEWTNVLTSEIWEIEEIEKDISPSLFLSYNPLPSNLKQCFMYCAIFQKDTKIHKDKLVNLWMAQGFLGSGENRNLEKIGCDYFDNLAMHSFFQDIEKGPEGNITSCKMHDLVHDFALFLTKGECSFLEVDQDLASKKVRHLVAASLGSSSIFMAENLRTLMITKSINPDQLIEVFNHLKCLRTLDLSHSGIGELPRQVKKLLHLRYLDLSGTKLVVLPETICYLYNLQTLKLNGCTNFMKLPAEIGNLPNLRHLELKGTRKLSCLPRGIGRLRYLRSLCKFIVGDASNGCNIKELKDLCYLHGSLEINGLNRVADASEAAQAELKNKSVAVLSLKFESLEGDEDSENSEEGKSGNIVSVLENLQPHENVEELNISSFRGSRLPSWIPNRSMSANLLKLALNTCHYTTKLPALGNLASLEELALRGMKSVKHIGCEFYGLGVAFPKLKKLEIHDMEELLELDLPVLLDARTIMPCLQKLILSKCPMLRELPPGLGKLESLDSLVIEQLSQVKYIGQEFYGLGLTFPKLKKLVIEDMEELVELELPVVMDGAIMPCLKELILWNCPMLRALPPSLGKLGSLKRLKIKRLSQVRHIGQEFYGSDNGGTSNLSVMAVAFPWLKVLTITDMNELVEWELPIARDNKKIMPCLSELNLSNCPMLRALPGLGALESLKSLRISELPSIRQMGLQFLGISSADEFGFDDGDTSIPGFMAVAFPQLKVLEIKSLNELVEWKLPVTRDNKKIMPFLSELYLLDCPMLRALPALGTLESLERLLVRRLHSIKLVGLEFLGISAANDEFGFIQERVINGAGEGEEPIIPNLRTTLKSICSTFSRIKHLGLKEQEGGGLRGSSSSYVRKSVKLFPKLNQLEFSGMDEWEVWILPLFQEDRQIMPRLSRLHFCWCQKLRALPDLAQFKSLESLLFLRLEGLVELEQEDDISFPCLRELTLSGCPNLLVIPCYLFPHTLRYLTIKSCNQLRGVQPYLPLTLESLHFENDVGVFSKSLPIGEEENNNYSNLIRITIFASNHPSLPKGFHHLTSVQHLRFYGCESLDFNLKELKHLTMLQELYIYNCPILAKRFQSSGDGWMSILSHVPNIIINSESIKGDF